MSAASSAASQDRQLDPGQPSGNWSKSPIEMASYVGRCRGYALNTGALAVLCATAQSAEELAELTSEFHTYRRSYIDIITENEDITVYLRQFPEIAADVKACFAFLERLSQMPDVGFTLDRDAAKDLAWTSRHVILPAIYRIIARLEADEEALRLARARQTQEKAALVDGMLSDMSRIGRMIGLISINASVEAARAGGASGRAFQVIAQEVRDLARQSSTLLEQTKARLAEDDRRSQE